MPPIVMRTGIMMTPPRYRSQSISVLKALTQESSRTPYLQILKFNYLSTSSCLEHWTSPNGVARRNEKRPWGRSHLPQPLKESFEQSLLPSRQKETQLTQNIWSFENQTREDKLEIEKNQWPGQHKLEESFRDRQIIFFIATGNSF